MTTSQLIVGQLYIWHRTSLLPILHYQMRLAVSIVIQNDRLGSQIRAKTFFSSHFSSYAWIGTVHNYHQSLICLRFVCFDFFEHLKVFRLSTKNKSSKDLRILDDHLYISVTLGKQLNILEYLDRRSSRAKSCLFKKNAFKI